MNSLFRGIKRFYYKCKVRKCTRKMRTAHNTTDIMYWNGMRLRFYHKYATI